MSATADKTTPSPARRITRILLLTAGGIVLLIGGCIAVVIRSGTVSYKESQVAANHFLQRIEHHDYVGACGEMSTAAQAAVEPASIGDAITVMEKRHGKIHSHSGPVNWRENSFNGVSTVTLVYTETFAHGSTEVTLVLINEDDGWHPQNFQFAL